MPADHIQELGTDSYAAGQGICEKGYKETDMSHSETDVSGEAHSINRCYVIQTITAQEQILVELIQKQISPMFYTEIFIPKRQMNRRIRGKWQNILELLFPGYVFIISDNPAALFQELRNIPRLSKLLHAEAFEFIPLKPAEQRFIEKIGQRRGDHIFAISEIELDPKVPYQRGDSVRITSGDLKDFEGYILYLDIHKRKAVIRTEMFGGNSVDVHVGIEIVTKL